MSGATILLRKEMAESWQTRRLPVVAVLFVLIGMASPLTARYLTEILGAALGDQLSIPLPTPTAQMAVDQLLKNLAQLGALAAIALAMGSVAGELEKGTAALVLAQPVTRPAFLAAKLAALGLVLAVCVVVASIAAWVYTAVLFEPQPAGGWLVMTLLAWLSLWTWAAITFAASAVTGSAFAAAGIGFVALVGLSLLAIAPAVDRLLPTGLMGPAAQFAVGARSDVDLGRLASSIAGSLVLVAASVLIAVGAFRRREL